MLHLPHSRAALLTLLVIPFAAICGASGARAEAVAAAPGPTGCAAVAQATSTAAASTAASAYLRARARGVLGPAQARALAVHCPAGSHLARREAVLAAGARRLAAALGHVTTAVSCRVRVSSVRPAGGGAIAVAARAVTLVTWSDRAGRTDTEGEGLDHILTLACRDGRWLVTADAYVSDLTPRLLAAGGAPRRAVAVAARSLELRARAASARADGLPATPASASSSAAPAPASAPLRATPGYVAKLTFDRSAAKAYADRYALSYDPTYTSFSSDCADFGSQVMFAGGYPQFGDTYASGWWYDKHGTSAPGNDTYSHAWIAVANQQGAWNVKYTDFVSSVSGLGAGDFIYYDWTGDGTWDHVAELVGTNSAGQRIVDAHTTDHYHVYWKLGTSATHYRYARARATVTI
jgi:hypothetical protein